MSMNVNGSTQQTGTEWFRNMKMQKPDGNVAQVPPPQADRAADYVRAYGNLYDEIVQGYKDGTAQRYVEDENSETGFRKMTLDEELAGLDKAFQKMTVQVLRK